MKFSNKRTLQYSDQFKKNHMTSKQDLLKKFDCIIKTVNQKSQDDTRHSAAYYHVVFSTTDNIEIKKCIQVTEAEKKKLELFLIAHPLVKYDMDFLRAD